MSTPNNVGAQRRGQSRPARSDNAPWPARVEGNGKADSGDFASKVIDTATARAALLGIEVHQIDGGAWLLRHARGACIGTVRSLDALDAAIGGFEAAQRDVRELVRRMRGANE